MKSANNIIVIFGASGDLTRRKLIPALYHLYKNNQLPDKFAVLGVSRSELDDTSFRDAMRQNLIDKENAGGTTLDDFCTRLYYQSLNTADRDDYGKLVPRLDALHAEYQTGGNTLYYLSTPPSLYGIIPACLAAHGLNSENHGWKRLIVEKPFGYDAQTARELDETIHHDFLEHQIYRIDHYLGKETVQNLLVLRFSNGLFEPLWNRNYIDYVEITAAETISVENRGGYYDGSGAVRDMFQNHLLQILAMVAMEPPALIDADSIRDEAAKVLHSLHPLDAEYLKNNLVLAQYGKGEINGRAVPGYRQEKGVAPDSSTETYMALRLQIDNWRWSGVPFYIRTGKYLPLRFTEVVIHFKTTPHPVFNQRAPENKLILRIQPDEGIAMRFGLKKPGAGFESEEVAMDFRYADLANNNVLTAYERLLLDAMKGDATLFARTDAVHACWKYVQPILDYKANRGTIASYEPGSWGPVEADKMIARSGRVWRQPKKN
ncbi:glucose-6-phosphate dehydrogenase [Cardiobacterium valvarum]|uniref:Glucose-6-phosphate 1-dehydrogenase n=1 Tax=Cardiobacterium valvarum F0432 TaxID=797473 RepID=G9ZI78_9GAMM|nr:glucose-6-phosphate dehydrogenase [Cardiobacterium valvarum]EHM52114.1 glucose-6-phosphate dehydrogenase [Cardiobacterium valvarum F0432]